MIGFTVNFSGNTAFGSYGLAGGGNADTAASRLLAGSALSSLAGSRSSIAQIQAALTSLRDTLQAARGGADAVPGRTTLKAVTADIERYVDQPTYVTINGKPVQNGTVTVSQGTQQVVVGYERVSRASLAVHDAVKALSAAVANVVSAAGQDGGGVGGGVGAGAFANDVSALLKNGDFNNAVARPDAASLDAAISQIDGVLAGAAGLGFTVSQRASAAAQVDLGGLLLGASATLFDGVSSLTDSGSGTGAYQTTSNSTSSTSSGSTLSTIA